MKKPDIKHPPRFVTAASLFDGHDASINIIRRLLQAGGAEVIHLGHNRSVHEIVSAAVQEDANAIAVSSYQGGHNEFFHYMVDLLKSYRASHIQVFGGGGGVITPPEIKTLEADGVTRIYSPVDGQKMGLNGIIADMLEKATFETEAFDHNRLKAGDCLDHRRIAQALTDIERREITSGQPLKTSVPVIGITGTGGAGKSSLTDELILRLLEDYCEPCIAILSIDPSKRKSGGALLGDRIRMNSIDKKSIYMRSFASHGHTGGLTPAIPTCIQVLEKAGFELIFVETSGIGQGDSAITDLNGISLYVMTSEYGASTQLEKIDMIDFADTIVINKFERRGSEDAYRDVVKQYQRSRNFNVPEDIPVFGTIANQFNDPGVNALYTHLLGLIQNRYPSSVRFRTATTTGARPKKQTSAKQNVIIPNNRIHYLSEIASTIRNYHQNVASDVSKLKVLSSISETLNHLTNAPEETREVLRAEREKVKVTISPDFLKTVEAWPKLKASYNNENCSYTVRGETKTVPQFVTTLAGTKIPKVMPPRFSSIPEIARFLAFENLPGFFPFTAGIYPFKRLDESPKRQFAGEGPPDRTNRRFHYLCRNDTAKRLSTAFDSVTLYGEDPHERPDIFGKIGDGGVSIATLDDVKILYSGFDLCHSNTSVSMTINGPAPLILAMFFNTAIDQQVDKFKAEKKRPPSPDEYEKIHSQTLSTVRGTVQADILKEDQAQNTCIFTIDFALKMMGDIQEYFIKNGVRNFYSVSISGYHIAEAGANPITQLALTLGNAFTYVEYYLSRGMKIDDFAQNLSFFFSNGLDAEYSVMARVARRIWAIAMRDRYGANERSQKFKVHIQTSGRSLHAQEISFNDIRTTLQALTAIYDNCNSLHTNSYDEAITTPTEESVRRAMAIQMIIQNEFGLAKNENPLQGSFIVEELTDLVEEAVLSEFERICTRGGVLGAAETQYQRLKIQEESLLYERMKDSGELPIVGVNMFLNPGAESEPPLPNLMRATPEEKQSQLERTRAFKERNKENAPPALERLRKAALSGRNIFEELMNTVHHCSLGEITNVLYDIGGKYRRGM